MAKEKGTGRPLTGIILQILERRRVVVIPCQGVVWRVTLGRTRREPLYSCYLSRFSKKRERERVTLQRPDLNTAIIPRTFKGDA